jgi:hypothetical protein
MGRAGRQKAVEEFSWSRVIRAYESLWQEQEQERRRQQRLSAVSSRWSGPAAYPSPEWTFAGYPTFWLDSSDQLQAAADAGQRLAELLRTPLTNHVAESRSADEALLTKLLAHAERPCSIAELELLLEEADVSGQTARATLGWLLKYDLLRFVPAANADDEQT